MNSLIKRSFVLFNYISIPHCLSILKKKVKPKLNDAAKKNKEYEKD